MEKVLNEIKEKISESKSVAIITNINEDPDTIASCLAMKRVLENMGKTATIYVSGIVEKRIWFIGRDYQMYKPQKNYNHDLCICIDCGDVLRIGDRKALLDEIQNSINIDHHRTNTGFAQVNLVCPEAAAAGEILFYMFKELDIPIDDEIARLLFTAISSDTGSFKYSNVTPRTMHAAADLLEFDFDNALISHLLFDSNSMESSMIEAKALMEMECYADGKIKLVTMKKSVCEEYGIAMQDAPNLVDVPRRIEGTEIALCFKEIDCGIRVNLRSNGEADVSKVALELGGGGHIKAAGVTLEDKTMEEAKAIVVPLCEKAL